jgi:hypothetical protein
MERTMRNILITLFVGSGLLLLVGCGCWPGKKAKKVAKDDVVLLKIDSKPVLTKKEFYKELAGMIGGMDPALLPKDKQERAFRDFMNFKLMVAAAKKAGLEKDKEYLKNLNEQIERLSEVLLSRMFEKFLFDKTEVSVDDVRAEYNKNKLRYVKEQGGVLVSGVSFKNLGKAKTFYEIAKTKRGNKDAFDSMCKKEKDGKFMEFGRIGKEEAAGYGARFVPKGVREAALKLSKLPAIDLVKEGDETWVIYVSDKKDPVLFTLGEIEKQIERQLKANKFMSERNRKIKELEKDLNVEINEAFFKQMPPKVAPSAKNEVASEKKQGGESA